jgi:hypothetical protein
MDSLIRYSAPTKFDKAPQFTACKVVDDDKNETIYVQISDDPEYGTWMKMTDLIGKALLPLAEDPTFIKACLNLIKESTPEKVHTLAHIIDKMP